jgi:hypothetical protein
MRVIRQIQLDFALLTPQRVTRYYLAVIWGRVGDQAFPMFKRLFDIQVF